MPFLSSSGNFGPLYLDRVEIGNMSYKTHLMFLLMGPINLKQGQLCVQP